MGHGDKIVLADGNFPAKSLAKRLIRLDGHMTPPLLNAVLTFFPLDTFVDSPVMRMETGEYDADQPEIWEEHNDLMTVHRK